MLPSSALKSSASACSLRTQQLDGNKILAPMGAQSLALGCFPVSWSSDGVDIFPGVRQWEMFDGAHLGSGGFWQLLAQGTMGSHR